MSGGLGKGSDESFDEGAGEGLIDWDLAQRVAAGVAGSGPEERLDASALIAAAEPSAELVIEYSGLRPKGALPEPELIDRREWVATNLATLREVAATIERRLADSLRLPGAFGAGARAIAGAATGVEVGLVSGYLAQRVVGQYDIALIGPSRTPRLLFVGPNLVELRRRIGADRDLLLRWIALHESTHAVQFAAVPWLRDHVGGLVARLVETTELRIEPQALLQRVRSFDPRPVIEGLRKGDLIRLLAGEERRELLDELQATMAVIEGYSDHVMDAVGEQLDPRYGEMRDRFEQQRTNRSPLELLITRLLGLDMKLRQYSLGKAFADATSERAGIEGLNRVWSEPAALPSLEELERPELWLARTGLAAVR
ncbi:MAG: hypothetical protein QOJ38_1743 [Solirubrobacterales bacterium]|jgi:coenzyme F420 biosynthesis associated uncharacterized protein|nr:hypothetical protein [Solirubrobacterales bacterium]